MAATTDNRPGETFAEGLIQAFEALQALAGITWDVGEDARVRACVTVLVHSEAEVDGAAALLGTVPERPAPGQYRAVKPTGAVTVSVALAADPCSAPADPATVARVCDWSMTSAPGSTS